MKSRLFALVFANLGFKLLSLMLAIVVWWIVQGEQIQEVNRELTVVLRVPSDYLVRGETVLAKAVTIRGPRVLMPEAPAHLEAYVDVPPKVGRFRVRLDKDSLQNWNERLQLTIHDPFIALVVDEKAVRTVPIKEVLHGLPADGMIIEKLSLKPKTVSVTGLKSEVARIKQIATEPIDISGINQSKQFDVQLVAPGMPSESLSETQTQVSIQLGDSKVNKHFTAIPIEVNGTDLVARFKPAFVTIVVQGTADALSRVQRKELRAYVEVNAAVPGRYDLDVKVKIPPDTVLIETVPERVSLSLSLKKSM